MIEGPGGILAGAAALISALCLGSLPLARAYVIVSNQRRLLRANDRALLARGGNDDDAIEPRLDAA